MKFPCQLKRVGGSHYVIVNILVLQKFKLKEGDILSVDFIGKEK